MKKEQTKLTKIVTSANSHDCDMLESYMNSLKYAEVVIKYKGQRYHIEAGIKKYTIGVFKKKEYEIDYFFDIEGDSYDDAYNKLMNEPLFGGEALKDILDKIEWLES